MFNAIKKQCMDVTQINNEMVIRHSKPNTSITSFFDHL